VARQKKAHKPSTVELLPFDEYDLFIVSFSGGKDSMACLLNLLELGVDPEKIQLWHQLVDGALDADEPNFMDWPITEDYCQAVADVFGVQYIGPRLLYQWKIGGFEGEMLRENSRTKGVCFETQAGKVKCVPPSKTGKIATRLRFPQKGRDMNTRWCTAYLKIDVAARSINNDPELDRARILFMTGERREESGARATYAEREPHRSNTKKRLVHHWRPVIDWDEMQVWEIMKRWHVRPHPCYYIGFGRCSCIACIFGQPDQWATIREIAPDMFDRIAEYEASFGVTIDRKYDVNQMADRGEPYPEVAEEPEELKLAFEREYPRERVLADPWKLPGGAYRETGGPT
jgi:3'-phosphoadenosine 5'-phosphosulfate sulfotransferase (PAPS reductase)/FAD synthetase